MMTKKNLGAPRFAQWLLSRMKEYDNRFNSVADLHEEYLRRCEINSRLRAGMWYRLQVFGSLPSYLRLRNTARIDLVLNTVKIALRNISRHPGFSFINIFGLAAGMTACLLIVLWVRNELSYDRYHPDPNHIYQVMWERLGHDQFFGTTPPPLAEVLRKDYPDFTEVMRLCLFTEMTVKREEIVLHEMIGAFADPSIFEMFSFPLSSGSSESFSSPETIFVTEKTSRRLFGHTDCVGQIIEIGGKPNQIGAVLKDPPPNTDFFFDYLKPFSSMPQLTEYKDFIWNWFAVRTFVRLKNGLDPKNTEQKIGSLLNTKRPWIKDKQQIFLYPLAKLHLQRPEGGGPIRYVYVFACVALLILLIACINYVNLSTARSALRAKEVGLRKVVGSQRSQLIRQFFGESLTMTLLAAVCSLAAAQAVMPWFARISGRELHLDLGDPLLILIVLGLIILTGFSAGGYPAFVLSSFHPIEVLRGNIFSRGRTRSTLFSGQWFRTTLVITQFVLSVGLMIGALGINKQVGYMKHGDLGFDKENLIRLALPEGRYDTAGVMKQDLLADTHVKGVSVYGIDSRGGQLDWDGAPENNEYHSNNVNYMMVDEDYIPTAGIEIIEGRNFSKEFPSDRQNAYLVNREAVRQWGLKPPVAGRRLSLNGTEGTIIGVFENVHFGLKRELSPNVFYLTKRTQWDETQYLRVRLQGHLGKAVPVVKEIWNRHIHETTMDFRFLDAMIDEQYRSEERLSGLINAFTILAVFISCLGLVGLVAFLVQRRTKEIGIRKVLGASSHRIMLKVTGEFLRWILVAIAVACPAAYFLINSWLNSYPYRMAIGADLFLLPSLAAVGVALASVAVQTIRAALANPAKSLRYE
jgi:putative ABC transport system permease protein